MSGALVDFLGRICIDNHYQLEYNNIKDIAEETKARRKIMTILEGTVRGNYIVTDMQMEENIMRRLEALGITNGTCLKLMNRKKNGSVIIKIRGTRWAIGKDIAVGIEVYPEKVEENVHGNN